MTQANTAIISTFVTPDILADLDGPKVLRPAGHNKHEGSVQLNSCSNSHQNFAQFGHCTAFGFHNREGRQDASIKFLRSM
eukprot:30468-Eustigmatos_ZCMA.PRE.1